MDEFTWLCGRDPEAMLRFLSGKISLRKLHLFLRACRRLDDPGEAGPPPTRVVVESIADLRRRSADPDAERLRQCQLLRDVFGNPFQPRRLDAAWLRWNDGAVRKMVRGIYDEGRFADLPVLADALEEAGCDDPFLLHHCRSGVEHVRGCWALDLLQGRE